MPWRKKILIGVTLILSLISLSGITRAIINGAWDVISVSLLLSGIPVVLRLDDLRRTLQSSKGHDLERTERITSTLKNIADRDSRLKNVGSRNELVLCSPNTDVFLRHNTVLYGISSERRRALAFIQPHYDLMSMVLKTCARKARHSDPPKHLFNERKVSLLSDINSDLYKATVRSGYYYEGVLTNDLLSTRLVTCGERPTILLDGFETLKNELFAQTADGLEIKGLRESRLSNHIGISAIAIGQDSRLRLWRQKHTAQQSGGLLAPTGSGSLDVTDLDPALSLNASILHGMKREFWEESMPHRQRALLKGLNWQSQERIIEDVVSGAWLLGYFRWMRRGGKPEFVGIVTLNVNVCDLLPNVEEVDQPDRWPLDWEVSSVDQVARVAHKILTNPRELADEPGGDEP